MSTHSGTTSIGALTPMRRSWSFISCDSTTTRSTRLSDRTLAQRISQPRAATADHARAAGQGPTGCRARWRSHAPPRWRASSPAPRTGSRGRAPARPGGADAAACERAPGRAAGNPRSLTMRASAEDRARAAELAAARRRRHPRSRCGSAVAIGGEDLGVGIVRQAAQHLDLPAMPRQPFGDVAGEGRRADQLGPEVAGDEQDRRGLVVIVIRSSP